MKRTIFILLAVVALGGLIGWRLASNKKHLDESKKVVDRSGVVVPVTVVNAEKKPISGNYTATATLEAWAETDIVAATQGKLTQLSIEVGSIVGRGQAVFHSASARSNVQCQAVCAMSAETMIMPTRPFSR